MHRCFGIRWLVGTCDQSCCGECGGDGYRTCQGGAGEEPFDKLYHGARGVGHSFAFQCGGETIDLKHSVKHLWCEFRGFQTKCTDAEEIPELLSVSLGAAETTLINLTSAYAPFVNGGKKIEPKLINNAKSNSYLHSFGQKLIFFVKRRKN